METFTDDTVVALASFLSPHDMLSLALSSKRFGDKHGRDTKRSATRKEDTREESSREVRQKVGKISLMEIAARTVLHAKWSNDEMNALPRREDESWIGIYQEFLKLFHYPLQFDKLAGQCIEYVDDTDKTRVCSKVLSDHTGAAICQNIMKSGKHYVSFQVNGDDLTAIRGITLGIMRPTTNDITSLEKCYPANCDLSRFSLKDYVMMHSGNNVDCCLFNTWMGNGLIRERWKEWEESELAVMDREEALHNMQNKCRAFHWEGMQPTQTNAFKIGLELDIDEGTLDVYKNDRRLGTMMRGLVGEYCWVISMVLSRARFSVSIGR